MFQKLSVNNFQWIKDTSRFNEDFIKYYNEESNERYFLEVDGQYLQKLHELHNNLIDNFITFTWRNSSDKIEKLVPDVNAKLNILDA